MARSQLSLLVRQCLHQRIPPEEFREMLEYATKKWKTTATDIVANLLNCAFGFCLENDPLVAGYMQIIVACGHAAVSDFISALIVHWQKSAKNQTLELPSYTRTLAQIIAEITVLTHNLAMSNNESRSCIMLSARWLCAFFRIAAHPELKHVADQYGIVINALHFFLVTNMNTNAGSSVLKAVEDSKDDPMNVTIRQAIKESENDFPGIFMALLAGAQKHPALAESSQPEMDNDQNSAMAALQFEQSITDAQIVSSRNATYTYLYIKLLNSSTIDDTALYTYLSTRHHNNNALIFNDLLFSSFDTLTKPTQAQEPMYQAQCRIFIHNKLPSILAFIAANEPMPTEQYLHELWNEVSAVGNTDSIANAKHFLHVCVLHHLVSANAVTNLTGEDANSSAAKGLFPKQALVDQVKGNATRGPRLVDELAKNDGNVGPVAQAIVEVMHRYCAAKVTQHQHLRDMASALVQHPATINSLCMFVSPSYFLAPLCQLLDEWRWEDLHGEGQPIYEEFGCVLLLIMTVKFKLGLPNDELGLSSSSGFVAQYLSSGQSEKQLSQITAKEQKHMSEWISNLYFAEGLSDEVTTLCSAMEFYMMVPTILRQSITALARGKLSEDSLKGGLDYFLESFLLPSLLSSFAWLAKAAEKDLKSVMFITQVLTKSPSNPETSRLHRTILDMASAMFHKTNSRIPNQFPFSDLLNLFGNSTNFCLRQGVKDEEMNTWISQEGGISAQLQRAVADIVAVSSAGLFQPKLLLAAAQLNGPNAIIQDFITLLVQFSANHEFAHLLDVIATIITASDSLLTTSLRNSLQLAHARLDDLLKKEGNLFATALVHLHRRVELYATVLTPQPATDEHDLIPLDGVDLGEINLDQLPPPTTTEAQKPAQQDQALQQEQQLSGEDMDQMLNEAANMGSIDDYTQGDDTNMFGMDEYDLTNLEDLDLNMFQ